MILITVLEFKLQTLCPALSYICLDWWLYADIISLPSNQSCSVAITKSQSRHSPILPPRFLQQEISEFKSLTFLCV
jgi:hypothetical protein